jgi:hypothetical protein
VYRKDKVQYVLSCISENITLLEDASAWKHKPILKEGFATEVLNFFLLLHPYNTKSNPHIPL